MSANPHRKTTSSTPTPIGASALENLRYIRDTIAAAGTVVNVPAAAIVSRI